MTNNYNKLYNNERDVEQGFLQEDRKNDSFYLIDTGYSRPPSRSIKRLWNQLSRLQRFMIIMLIIFLILCVIVLLPWTDSSFIYDGRTEIQKNAQIDNILIDYSVKDKLQLVSTTSKAQEKDLVKLKMEKVDFENGLVEQGFVEKIDKPVLEQTSSAQDKQNAIVAAFQHAWKGYKSYAWGHDHVKPIAKTFQNWFGLGLTIVDSLDTMYIMGLKEEFHEAKKWVKEKLNFNLNRDVNFFETTIRVLGGLLSAFHLSKDSIFLDKAVDLANRLMPGFKSSSGMPYSDVNLQTGHAHPPAWGQDSTVSEISTVQLEFRDVSRLTGDPKYETAAFKVSEHLHQLPKKEGLVPMFINAETGQFRSTSTITIGARADSYYEYLLKQWVQTGRTIDWLKEDYMQAVDGILKHLVKESSPGKLTFVGELLSGRSFSPKMDHLVCYLPGTLALGYHYGMPSSHLKLAFDLMDTCYNMYAQTATKLSPEIVYFNLQPHGSSDIIIKSNDAHNLLRPETVESLWYLYHFTRNDTYRDWGWQIFQAFEKYAKVEDGGYTSIGDVRNPISSLGSSRILLKNRMKWLIVAACVLAVASALPNHETGQQSSPAQENTNPQEASSRAARFDERKFSSNKQNALTSNDLDTNKQKVGIKDRPHPPRFPEREK
ncbi:hypothetical protein JTE90_018635 [Oedothorax gibbosus]|uniref:alpha-1,2-Mannosidase n=1 Tax=Oedothorax gibbosus TaxID=931172 RepID=A0AAV6ULT8_9ARAC|nr:hypothetical protein JTE90_018635 [Oedothorax gibbosus]